MTFEKTMSLVFVITMFKVTVMAKQSKSGASTEEEKVCDAIKKQNDEVKKQQEKVKNLIDRIAAEIERTSCDEDYALYFPKKGTTDYAVFKDVPSLTAFTLCFWMNSTDQYPGSPFSYCHPSAAHGNELAIDNYGSLKLLINNDGRDTGVAANDGKWHHICFSWTNSDGYWHLYKDGELLYNGKGFKTGYTIKENGVLIVGQEQDLPLNNRCGVQFDYNQSFQGYMTNLNLWSSVLPAETIQEMSQTCSSEEGDVLKWSDFKHNLKGDTEVVVPSPCVP